MFFNKVGKVYKFFTEYEKALGHEKKDVDDHGLINHDDGGEEPPPSPSSSDASHHSHRNSMLRFEWCLFGLIISTILALAFKKNSLYAGHINCSRLK